MPKQNQILKKGQISIKDIQQETNTLWKSGMTSQEHWVELDKSLDYVWEYDGQWVQNRSGKS